jgi:hypothetical protein
VQRASDATAKIVLAIKNAGKALESSALLNELAEASYATRE